MYRHHRRRMGKNYIWVEWDETSSNNTTYTVTGHTDEGHKPGPFSCMVVQWNAESADTRTHTSVTLFGSAATAEWAMTGGTRDLVGQAMFKEFGSSGDIVNTFDAQMQNLATGQWFLNGIRDIHNPINTKVQTADNGGITDWDDTHGGRYDPLTITLSIHMHSQNSSRTGGGLGGLTDATVVRGWDPEIGNFGSIESSNSYSQDATEWTGLADDTAQECCYENNDSTPERLRGLFGTWV